MTIYHAYLFIAAHVTVLAILMTVAIIRLFRVRDEGHVADVRRVIKVIMASAAVTGVALLATAGA